MAKAPDPKLERIGETNYVRITEKQEVELAKEILAHKGKVRHIVLKYLQTHYPQQVASFGKLGNPQSPILYRLLSFDLIDSLNYIKASSIDDNDLIARAEAVDRRSRTVSSTTAKLLHKKMPTYGEEFGNYSRSPNSNNVVEQFIQHTTPWTKIRLDDRLGNQAIIPALIRKVYPDGRVECIIGRSHNKNQRTMAIFNLNDQARLKYAMREGHVIPLQLTKVDYNKNPSYERYIEGKVAKI